MVTKAFLFEISYELVLFFLIVVLMYNASKTYFIPMLREQIKNVRTKVKDFTEKKELLISTQKRLEKEINEQAHELANLNIKIQSWRSAIIEKQQFRKEEQKIIDQNIIKRKEHQCEYIQVKKANEKIMPQIFVSTRKQIADTYEGERGKTLLHEVINDLQ
jgi:hypothetical protein